MSVGAACRELRGSTILANLTASDGSFQSLFQSGTMKPNLLVLCVVVIETMLVSLESPAKEQEKVIYFQVMGTSSAEPNRVRPWSKSYRSEADAKVELSSIQRSYAKGGLLEFATDKPTNLHVAKFTSSGQIIPGKTPEEGNDAASSSGVRGKTLKQPTPSNTSKKWVMWLEQKQQGQWAKVAGRRYEYDDYPGFYDAYGKYKKQLDEVNQNGLLYRLQWEEVANAVKPELPFIDLKKVDSENLESLLDNSAWQQSGGSGSNFRLEFRDKGRVGLIGRGTPGTISSDTHTGVYRWEKSGEKILIIADWEKPGNHAYEFVLNGKNKLLLTVKSSSYKSQDIGTHTLTRRGNLLEHER